jgi:hypothetical protein
MSPIIDDSLHFAFCLHRGVDRVELAPQPVGRAVQITQRVIELVLLGAGCPY